MNVYAQYVVNHPQNPPVDECGESDVGLAWRWH